MKFSLLSVYHNFLRYLKLLKGNGTFATSKSFYRCWRALLHMRKKSCIKPSVAPAMSLESVSVGADDKSENETRLRVCTVDLWCPLLLSAWGWGLKAKVATISIAHLNLQPNCWQLRCVVGNVGTRIWQEEECWKAYSNQERLFPAISVTFRIIQHSRPLHAMIGQLGGEKVS